MANQHSPAKTLRPPFIWLNQKTGLVEDERYQRWSEIQIRAMKDGTYDWSKHQEIPVEKGAR